ncbi:acyl-CoA N-acyltransferase [Hysterangium stoloniferum]|nr:acyl-CoA N-acyltransferase [Hysterangium stoloniferum]
MAEVPDHEIIEVEDKPLYDQCIQVRIDVFVHEQKFRLEDEIDDIDPIATHILLRLIPSKTPIGTLRVYKQAGASYYKLGRLAVLKEYRKFRLGAELVQAAHRYVAGQSGPAEIVVHSQLYVKGFYARLGYLPEGEEFDEDGAPHQKMKVQLPADSK